MVPDITTPGVMDERLELPSELTLYPEHLGWSGVSAEAIFKYPSCRARHQALLPVLLVPNALLSTCSWSHDKQNTRQCPGTDRSWIRDHMSSCSESIS